MKTPTQLQVPLVTATQYLYTCNDYDLIRLNKITTLNGILSSPLWVISTIDTHKSCKFLILGEKIALYILRDSYKESSKHSNNVIIAIGEVDSSNSNLLIRAINEYKGQDYSFRYINSQNSKALNELLHIDLTPADDYDNLYYYDTEASCQAEGSVYSSYRSHLSRFRRIYAEYTETRLCSFGEFTDYTEAEALFDDWLYFNTEGSTDYSTEKTRFNSFLQFCVSHELKERVIVLTLWVKNKLAGFSFLEVDHETSIAKCHFQKSNLNLSYVSDYLFFTVNSSLAAMGIKYFDFGEDGGIEGLRSFKKRMHPVRLVNVYEAKIVN